MSAKLLTAAEAAEHIGITPRWLNMLAAKGEVPCVRYGPKTIRYDLPKVVQALEKRGRKSLVPTY